MSVYFITCRETATVKIGCADEPAKRLKAMQTGCPHKLVIEAVFKGSYKREREFHAQFAEHRIRGEWFNLTPEIEATIVKSDPPEFAFHRAGISQEAKLKRLHQEREWEARMSHRLRILSKRRRLWQQLKETPEKMDALRMKEVL